MGAKEDGILKQAGQFFPTPITVNYKYPVANVKFIVYLPTFLLSSTLLYEYVGIALTTTCIRSIDHAQKAPWSQESSMSLNAAYVCQ